MKKALLTMLAFTLFMTACNKDDNPTPTPEPEPTVELKSEINDFIWKGLNSEYYWQKDVPNLADTKDDDKNEYHTFLNSYTESSDLLYNLCYKHRRIVGNDNAVDRFTWYIEDYKAQNASFRGVNDSFGFEFKLARVSQNSNEVIGYITYVVPNSPAADAELKRGDIFNEFNGTILNLDNYRIVNKYYSDQNISIKLAKLENGILESLNEEAINLAVRTITENPVHLSKVITTNNGTKVGYLVYNGFKFTFHNELNDVFGEFKNAGIQELVLDFRYNGGGALLTCSYLASMIYGTPSKNDVFAKLIYNSKKQNKNTGYPFYETARVFDKETGKDIKADITINRLNNLQRVFIIVTDDTASASEMIINGLRGYGVEVILIGEKTYGKNVGSYTVYDSPDFSGNNINPNHTVAMQPITFRIYNKLDQSDYTHGFEPTIEAVEYAAEMKPFGDTNEPLLKVALDKIDGAVTKTSSLDKKLQTREIFNSVENKKFSKEMYILNNE